MVKFSIVFFLFWGLSSFMAFAQEREDVCPTVPDFMDVEEPWVTVTYGTTADPFENIGIMSRRHVLITEQGTDYLTNDQLELLPEGVDRVIRLGNSDVGREAESITYRFIADRERPLLLLRFAVVLEDPGHPLAAQPRFRVEVLDRNGEPVEDCSKYDVSASTDMEGFHRIERGAAAPIVWRDWTSIGIDLSAYGGEEIQIRFVTYDCNAGEHFGYAYFYASCVASRLSVRNCGDKGFELEAPAYFASYLWNDGQTTQVAHWPKGRNENISCEMTSMTGCRLTLFSTIMEAREFPLQDTLVYDTICEGESYQGNGFDLPAQSKSGTYSNSLVDVSDCRNVREVNMTLALHVVERYMLLEEYICEGEDYTKYGFDIRKPSVGEYSDTLELSVSGRCKSYRVLDLQVSSSEMQPRIIVGDKTLCGGEIVSYHVSVTERGDRYQWECPEDIALEGGATLPAVTLRLPLEEMERTLKLHIRNGCGNYETALPLKILPAYHFLYEDTVCSGTVYRKNGFVIPPKEAAGSYIEAYYDKTRQGCDSIAILKLEVVGNPKVEIALKDSAFCVPEEIALTAVVEGIKVKKSITVGDVLCTDGAVLKVEEYKSSGKTAKAIVFWVDRTGEHGWAVDVWEPEGTSTWGRNPNLPLKEYSTLAKALADYDGRGNTDLIIENEAKNFPAFNNILHGEEWYMPAAGQWYVLYSSYAVVNQALQEVGGKPLQLTGGLYWTSTRNGMNDFYVWFLKLDNNGITWDYTSMIIPYHSARGICDF